MAMSPEALRFVLLKHSDAPAVVVWVQYPPMMEEVKTRYVIEEHGAVMNIV